MDIKTGSRTRREIFFTTEKNGRKTERERKKRKRKDELIHNWYGTQMCVVFVFKHELFWRRLSFWYFCILSNAAVGISCIFVDISNIRIFGKFARSGARTCVVFILKADFLFRTKKIDNVRNLVIEVNI